MKSKFLTRASTATGVLVPVVVIALSAAVINLNMVRHKWAESGVHRIALVTLSNVTHELPVTEQQSALTERGFKSLAALDEYMTGEDEKAARIIDDQKQARYALWLAACFGGSVVLFGSFVAFKAATVLRRQVQSSQSFFAA